MTNKMALPPWKYVPAHIAEGDAEVRHPDGWLICTTPSDDLAKQIVQSVNAGCDLSEAIEILRLAQSVGAMMTEPDAINKTSSVHAYAHCIELERNSRTFLAKHGE